MTLNMANHSPPNPGIDVFHKERSKCIDAFVSVEVAVIQLLDLTSTKFGSEPFGRKVKALKEAKPTPQYSKERKAKVDLLLVEAIDLFEVRNDLVHARLQLAIIGTDQRACLTNARHCLAGSQTARLFTLDGLRAVARQANALAEALIKT